MLMQKTQVPFIADVPIELQYLNVRRFYVRIVLGSVVYDRNYSVTCNTP